MGKEEDRGSPFLIFPSNPSASTATAPPQRQRGRCCEDAGENSLLKESFPPPSQTIAKTVYPARDIAWAFPSFSFFAFLISYLSLTNDSRRLTEHIRDWHTQRALLNDKKLAPAAHHVLLSILVMTSPAPFSMLWYSTHWTATAFSNDPLWLTLFVEGVNDRLLDHCQVSSVPHYCGFKEQEIPRIYTVWMVIYWNSNVNIIIFWDTDFWLSWAVSSNHPN